MKQLVMLLAALFLSLPAWAVEEIPATPAQKDALYDNLITNMACLCGCGTTLKTCPHEDCSFGIPAKREIRQMVDGGTGRTQIVDRMVKTRGEAILAAPTFSGFNVMAWVTPFVAIIIVGSLVAMILKRWAGNRPSAAPAAAARAERNEAAGETDPYLKKMREELDKYE